MSTASTATNGAGFEDNTTCKPAIGPESPYRSRRQRTCSGTLCPGLRTRTTSDAPASPNIRNWRRQRGSPDMHRYALSVPMRRESPPANTAPENSIGVIPPFERVRCKEHHSH
jgi:hypothetical protein